jgi:choline monooxygenase
MTNHNISIDEDITKASTLPGELYSSPAFFESTKQSIFSKSWHFVTDTDEVRVDGSIYPFVMSPGFLNEPLMINRTVTGLKCMSNVCTHRGNILVKGKQQNCKGITCCYHGKRFDLDGCFKSMPGFEEAKNFPTEVDNLPQVSLEEFGKLLFASIAPAFSFEDSFTKILDRLSFLPHNDLKHYPELSRDYLVKANWMLYCENYLEGFHIPFVHPGLSAAIDFGMYEYEIDKYFNLQIGIVKKGEETFDIPEGHVDFGKRVGAYYYWVFPNLMLNFYPWGLSINVVNPIEKDLTKVKFFSYVWDESKFDKGAGSDLDKVEREDEEIVERVQMGVKSQLYTKGRYSPTMEKGTHHFHRLVAEFCNA